MRIAVTGVGLSSPYGEDLGAFWQGLLRTPAELTERVVVGFPEQTVRAAFLPHRRQGPLEAPAAAVEGEVISLAERALRHAGLHERAGLGLALGSHFAETDYLSRPKRGAPSPLLRGLAAQLKLGGPVVNTPTGCSAGNTALAWAVDRLREGEVSAMLAGGFDLVGPWGFGGMGLMGNVTPGEPLPFDTRRSGFVFGEGGALLVLEPWDAAVARGATPLVELVSAGVAHDAENFARPSVTGRGLALALRRAFLEGGCEAREVGYVNAHSPGTAANDPGEAAAYRDVFGARGVPVSSTKAALGHAQGGANGLEAVATLLALQHRAAPPTLRSSQLDGSLELDVITGEPRRFDQPFAVSSATGLGGSNAVIVMKRVG